MRKTNGVDAYVYLKRAHVLENYPLAVSASGAILCEEALPPECIDLVTVLDRKGEEVTVYDSNVAELYPWVLRLAKGVTYSSGNADILLPGQPTVPTLRDLNEEPGGRRGSALARAEDGVELEETHSKRAMYCPGCSRDDRQGRVPPRSSSSRSPRRRRCSPCRRCWS